MTAGILFTFRWARQVLQRMAKHKNKRPFLAEPAQETKRKLQPSTKPLVILSGQTVIPKRLIAFRNIVLLFFYHQGPNHLRTTRKPHYELFMTSNMILEEKLGWSCKKANRIIMIKFCKNCRGQYHSRTKVMWAPCFTNTTSFIWKDDW